MGKRLFLLAVVGVLLSQALAACSEGNESRDKTPGGHADFYVATTGSDKDPGTEEAPLRTIRAAVTRAQPGDDVFVRGGTYRERVDFRRSGSATAPVTFKAYPGETANISRGFRVTGDYNVISGFVVSPGETSTAVLQRETGRSGQLFTAGQIQIVGDRNVVENIAHRDDDSRTPPEVSSLAFVKGSRNVVRNIDFRNCGAIFFSGAGSQEPTGTGEHNTVSGGTIHHTRSGLVGIEADYSTLEKLDMHDPGQVADGDNAADGINVNGAHITIRRNKIHGIFMQYEYQHPDAIQWWNRADNLLIEGNVIGSKRRGGKLGRRDQGHIQFGSGTKGLSSNSVIIRNNVFLGTDGSYILNSSPDAIIPGQADDWQLVGNTFRCPQWLRDDVVAQTRGWVIRDNIR